MEGGKAVCLINAIRRRQSGKARTFARNHAAPEAFNIWTFAFSQRAAVCSAPIVSSEICVLKASLAAFKLSRQNSAILFVLAKVENSDHCLALNAEHNR